MKTDLRYNLQHAGDVFAVAVHKTADSALVISKNLTGIYDPDSLHSRKKKLSGLIRKRVPILRKRENLVNVVQKTADFAVLISKKLMRAYDLSSLRSQRKKLADEIVERVSVLTTGGNGEISRDARLARLVASLNGVEKELTGFSKRSTRRVSPVTTILTKLGKALFGAKKER